GEHLHREAHRLVDDAGVEVHVRVQLVVDEVLVGERDPLQLQGDVDQRVAPGDLEHLLGDLLDDGRPRVEVLVDPVAEAHQPQLTALHAVDVGRDVVHRADVAQHPQHLLVRAAVQGAVQGGGGRGGGGDRVDP